ncbi:MAG: stalk domain-containing protein [Peptoniphilus harei]|uniref:stalk domain-containing protein n=1 Tax=Peptoniphilus harei TaxID=54005 RepID=UPI0025511CB2|nr:stalk domain-containing protein [Peptoniphilus harei]MDK7755338.1 stalk domain-containing protein [Peptoniphilus harei]MDK7761573.1 stalk domain-containing protein [Peptoniphilus harei]MDK8271098.1 stalk domain-containing protein [Peptoniphilus harei]MDK8339314.1 stalk domain-containing protein [Peptoniphilus harei]
MNKKKISIALILFFLLISSNVFAENKLLFQEPIAPGVVRYKYQVKRSKGNAEANVIKVDLNNPNAKINTVAGGGTYTNKATVSQMANRTNAVALVNGDFFTMQLEGAPQGPSVINGETKSSPAVLNDIWSFGIDSNDKAFIELTKFVGSVTASNGRSFPIDGLNKTKYWYQPSMEYSHQNKIQLYDSFWTAKTRGDKNGGEVLLNENNVVEQISYNKGLDMSIPNGKKILQFSGSAIKFIQDNVKVGDKLGIKYNIEPNRNWKMMIGGHAVLVDNGAVKPYTRDIKFIDGVRARTAVGISQDGKTVYVVTAEGRTKRSSGLTIAELAKFMQEIGVYKAMNLDGGGSTAMAVRNLGDLNRTRATNPERNGAERRVVNGLGVYNTSKNTGLIADGKFESDVDTIVGEQVNLKLKSAWDEFLNPIDIKSRTYTISDSSNGANILNGQTYLPLTPGKFTINLQADKGDGFSKEVNVADPSSYNNLKLSTKNNIVKKGSEIKVEAIGEYKGRKINISPRVLNYSFEDLNAEVNPNNFNIKINDYGKNPKILVKFGGKTASLSLYDENTRLIKMKINDVNYTVNGQAKKMDAKPFISNSRTLVPLRFIIEAIGGDVAWDGDSRVVTVNSKGKNIILPIDSKKITVDGKEIAIDQAAIIKGDRTYVPIRFVAENLGMNVNYINESREIEISYFEDKKDLDSKNIEANTEANNSNKNANNNSKNKSKDNRAVNNKNLERNNKASNVNQKNKSILN